MTKVDGQLSGEIRRLYEQVVATAVGWEKEVASITGGLPVYADMGGALAMTPEGLILRYDDETGDVVEEADERWQQIARISAAERYPDLMQLRPVRDEEAKDCSVCGGSGRVLGVRCAHCLGLGWIGGAPGVQGPHRS
jgi:hypothetical protein